MAPNLPKYVYYPATAEEDARYYLLSAEEEAHYHPPPAEIDAHELSVTSWAMGETWGDDNWPAAQDASAPAPATALGSSADDPIVID